MNAMAGRWSRRVRLLPLLLLAGLPGIWLLQPAGFDREHIEELVARAKRAFESRSVSQIMACTAQDYADDSGLTRADVARAARRLAGQVDKVEIQIASQEITRTPTGAVGRFSVRAKAYAGEEAIRWDMHLTVHFVQRRGGWRNLWRKAWVVKSVSGHGLDALRDELF